MKAIFIYIFFALFLASIPCRSQDESAQPQADTIKVDDIRVGYIRNSAGERVSNMDSSVYTKNRWTKVEVRFTTRPEYIDQLEFRYYLLMRDRRSMLTGSQTCMYVKKGRRHYTCIYVYPNAVERYGGGVLGVAVKVYVNGQETALYVVGEKSRRWWDTLEPISGSMVNWQMTPFDRRGVEKYESVKAE